MRRHLPFVAVAAIHQLAFWAVVLSNNPQATVTFDCVSGTMARDVLAGFAYSPFDTYDGILGGMAIGAMAGLPLFALFGISGLTVKAVAGLWSLGTVLVGMVFLDRCFDRRTAIFGGLTLALPMPTMFLASTILGNWHYTELLFELAAAFGLCWLVWGGGERRRGALFAFGLLSGLALFNCFGSLIFFGAFWLIMWAMLRVRAGWGGIAAYGLGALLGAAPLWAKLLLHTPYGAPALAAGGGTKVPKEMLALSVDPGKIGDLIVDNGFSWGLHFQDVLDVPRGTVFSMTLATVVTVVLFGGWLLLVLRTWPSMRRLFLGLLPGRVASIEDVSPAVVPALMGSFYALAWLLSDMNVTVRPWYLANVRDLGHATLIPWAMTMGLCGAVLFGRLVTQQRGGGVQPGERSLPARPVLIVLGYGLLAMVLANGYSIARAGGGGSSVGDEGGAATPSSGADSHSLTRSAGGGDRPANPSIYRGICHDVHGFYMGPHVVGSEAATESGAPLPASEYVARAERACAPYGPEAGPECRRGVAWSIGFGQVEFEEEEYEEGPGRGNECLLLTAPWRVECLRGMGWALQSMGEGGIVAASFETERCDDFESAGDRAACWRGVGFPLGDHLSNRPERLMRALQDFAPDRRVEIARGAATHLGRTYSAWSWMVGMCERWHEPYRPACLAGLEDSMVFRADAEAVHAR